MDKIIKELDEEVCLFSLFSQHSYGQMITNIIIITIFVIFAMRPLCVHSLCLHNANCIKQWGLNASLFRGLLFCSFVSRCRRTWGKVRRAASLCWRRTRSCCSTDSQSTKEKLTRMQRRGATWRMRVKTMGIQTLCSSSVVVKCGMLTT